jgi:hypothetical protein
MRWPMLRTRSSASAGNSPPFVTGPGVGASSAIVREREGETRRGRGGAQGFGEGGWWRREGQGWVFIAGDRGPGAATTSRHSGAASLHRRSYRARQRVSRCAELLRPLPPTYTVMWETLLDIFFFIVYRIPNLILSSLSFLKL